MPKATRSIAARVIERHAQLSRLNLFEVLGVSETADGVTLRAAFHHSIRSFHPDLLRGEDERLRPLANEIVYRINEAYQVLENDATRHDYLLSGRYRSSMPGARSSMPVSRPTLPAFHSQVPASRPSMRAPQATLPGLRSSLPASRPSLPGHGPSLPPPRPSLPGFRPSPPGALSSLPPGSSAEEAFEAARIQLKRGALDAALALAQHACEAAPKHAQYQALRAWLEVQRGELKPGPRADEILAILNRALRQQRDDLEIRMYRARVLQRLGRQEEAMRDFSFVARMDDTHLEAMREVRVHRMRTEQKPSTSGLFRFFVR